MNTHVKIARLITATVIGLCAQPLLVTASAQQSPKIAIDSVSMQLRSHSKPKKSAVAPLAVVNAPASAKSVKTKREVPSIIRPAVQPTTPQPAARKATAVVAQDSVPAVRRAATASKKKPSR